ncbi:MAG: hypothetical protein ACR2GN_04455, partial [Bacteroidia bacterium]
MIPQDTSSILLVIPDSAEIVVEEPDFSYIDTSFRFKDIIHIPGIQSGDTSITRYETLFGDHQLRPENSLPIAVSRDTPDWLFFILLLIIALLTWLKVFYRKNVLQIFEAFFSNVVANQIV